jgi:hypothetical protein
VWELRRVSLSYDHWRVTLGRREWPDCRDGNDEGSVRHNANGEGVGVTTRLRKLVLRGDVSTDLWEFPSVQKMLENVEQVEVHDNTHTVDNILQEIGQLHHVKRLLFQDITLPTVDPTILQRFSLWSARTLEELYYKPEPSCLGYFTEFGMRQRAIFLLWFHGCLSNLRVLATPCQVSLVALGRHCPRLTHLHAPYSRDCGFPEASRESLSRLCVVTLGISQDCAWLRSECGPGRSLPVIASHLPPDYRLLKLFTVRSEPARTE